MNIYYRNKKGTLVSTDLKREWELMKEFLESCEDEQKMSFV